MTNDDLAQKLSNLKQRYDEILAYNKLDRIAIPEEKGRESFNAIFSAGWWPNKAQSEDEAWQEFWAESSSRFVNGAYDRLVRKMQLEIEQCIQLRGATLPCSVLVETWPVGNTALSEKTCYSMKMALPSRCVC